METLRSRLVRPSLEAELTEINVTRAESCEGGLFVQMVLTFQIVNKGRVAAYKWVLSIDEMSGNFDGRENDYKFSYSDFPSKRGCNSGIRIDDTILPSLTLTEKRDFGLQLRPASLTKEHLIAELRMMIPNEYELKFRVVSETSPGELRSKKLADLIDYDKFVQLCLRDAQKSP